ncbi:chlorophyll synthase ChlG [Fischerella sp. PCC 9605]|uniref:chlorophyll synthase ChlG n=1 Tax=Fischerella sp. PCC 9605 TaxID=1173024 RepID=UPI00047B5D2B|nr:chlorophyll synthase ChlG [Fischerella sp. PCC 9605]
MSDSTPITPNSNTPDALESVAPTEEAASVSRSAKTRQLLGMKGAASGETSVWKIRLQLMKPITWIPLMWGVICGAASSGEYTWTLENVLKSLLCMLLAGPIMAGYTQTMNEYYDREIDAINEPYRPIPSGAIPLPQVVTQIIVLLLAGIAIAFTLDVWAGHEFPTITVIALVGGLIAYIYSAPPLKLKQNGWLGGYALGASYIAFPWCTGHALFGELNWKIVVFTAIYSLAGLGIAVVNDFKSIEGDRKFGLKSLPVMFGANSAAWICVVLIDVFQAAIAAYLVYVHENLYAALLALLIIPQITFQDMYFLRDPMNNDVKYQASAQPFLVLGMLVAGLAIGHAGI